MRLKTSLIQKNIGCFEKNMIFPVKYDKVMRYVCICSDLSVKLVFKNKNGVYI